MYLAKARGCALDKSRSNYLRCLCNRANWLLSLAFAELYLTLAAIVRQFRLSLYDTSYADIEPVCDAFMPMPSADSKGVRVMVN